MRLSEADFVTRPIPLTWLELHDALQERAASSENPAAVVSRAEVAALSPALPDDQREEALLLLKPKKLMELLEYMDLDFDPKANWKDIDGVRKPLVRQIASKHQLNNMSSKYGGAMHGWASRARARSKSNSFTG